MPLSPAAPPQGSGEAQRLQLLVDAISDYAIYMLDPDGAVVSWNAGAQRIQGYEAREIIGQHFSRFFTSEDRAEGLPARILQEARRAGRSETEAWRLRKDGSRYLATSLVQPVRDEGGRMLGFAEITRDITERTAAQEALLESERRFRLLVEGVVDYAIYMLDPSGVVVNWNAGAQGLKGYRAEEIVGQHFSRFYTREDRAAGLPMRMLDLAAREGRYEAEGWRVRKDGSRFWASVVVDAIRNEDGELLGFAKVTRDITERQAAQEALQESERQFRMLVESVVDYALFTLDPNGIITNWNSGAQRIKGYAAEEIVGQHFSRFHTEADRSAGVPARALRTAAEHGRFETEGWRVRKDGTLFWASVVIDRITDEARKIVGFAKITRDITEQREARLALERAQTQRHHTQKMEALGQLTGGVAHDFNNLLMIVGGHIETLKRLAASNTKGLRATEAIEHAAKRGESLTRQLLTFSRRQTLNPVVVDIRERIEAVHAMLTSSVGASARLVIEIPSDTWPVKIDVSEFELALINIALNCRDAMPQDGIITISAENTQLCGRNAEENLEGDFVALTIADTGCGIATDILPKVFDPFFTTKHRSKGTGLGLSQVHGFVHQSGGTVKIESELGKGTMITLYLPRVQASPEQAAAQPAAEASTSGAVLLVEDNPDVAEVSAGLLEKLGYEVHTAGDAQAALEALETHKFDLVVSDIVMAGPIDGLGLARAIRQRDPDLPLILVTGYSSSAVLADPEFAVLRKPYQLEDLSRAAAKVIAEAGQAPPSNLVRLRDVRRGANPKNERP